MTRPSLLNMRTSRVRAVGVASGLIFGRSLAIDGSRLSEALKGKKPTRNANSKIKVNKEAGPISPVLMD